MTDKLITVNNVESEGDKHLHPLVHTAWSFAFEAMLKFHCYITFDTSLVAPGDTDYTSITFYIPGDHPAADKIVEYIKYEWELEVREPSEWFGVDIPGFKVHIFKYSGVHKYIGRNDMKLERLLHVYNEIATQTGEYSKYKHIVNTDNIKQQ